MVKLHEDIRFVLDCLCFDVIGTWFRWILFLALDIVLLCGIFCLYFSALWIVLILSHLNSSLWGGTNKMSNFERNGVPTRLTTLL